MTCSKCHADGVKNSVLGKEFFYCRTCKTEIEAPAGAVGWDDLGTYTNGPVDVGQMAFSLSGGGYAYVTPSSMPAVAYPGPVAATYKPGDKVKSKATGIKFTVKAKASGDTYELNDAHGSTVYRNENELVAV